jgi:hypothetical protein
MREEHRLWFFEKRVLRGISWPKRDEMRGDGKYCISRNCMILYSSPNVFRVIKSRKMSWAGHEARMG